MVSENYCELFAKLLILNVGQRRGIELPTPAFQGHPSN
jgi:hypothetical protein